MPKFSMAYLMANGAAPLEAIEIAQEVGFDSMSFRLQYGDGQDLDQWSDDQVAEVKLVLDDHGLMVLDVEMIRLNQNFNPSDHLRFMEMCRTLGARHILVANDDPDASRSLDHFGRLCEALAEFSLTADLEFMPFTETKTLADAWRMVEQVKASNAAVLFDSLHADRSDSNLDLLSAIPQSRINYVQICDGFRPFDKSRDALIHVARCEREIPGHGDIDLVTMFRHLRADYVSVEVPNIRLMQSMSRVDLARQSLRASKQIIAQAWGD